MRRLRGYVDRVVIGCGAEVIARHPHSYEGEDMVFDPIHTERKWPKETRHRQVKYLNNVVEADHGKLKLLIRPVRGFKTMKTAYATIKGFEVMRALRKGQAEIFRPPGRHCRRDSDRRARLRSRTVRPDRGHGMATEPSGQFRMEPCNGGSGNMDRPPSLPDMPRRFTRDNASYREQ